MGCPYSMGDRGFYSQVIWRADSEIKTPSFTRLAGTGTCGSSSSPYRIRRKLLPIPGVKNGVRSDFAPVLAGLQSTFSSLPDCGGRRER